MSKKTDIDDNWLIEQYCNKRIGAVIIARQVKCTPRVVYLRLKELGIKTRKRGKESSAPIYGVNNPNWKGGRNITKDGYIEIKQNNHPHRNHHGYVLEHRLVMESVLGRYLSSAEIVHHKDGNKQNNDVNNLEVLSPSQHGRITHSGEKAYKAKLNNAIVLAIIQDKNTTNLEWSQKLNVNISTVKRIRNGSTWSIVTGIKKERSTNAPIK